MVYVPEHHNHHHAQGVSMQQMNTTTPPQCDKYLEWGERVDGREAKTAGHDKGSEVCAVEALQAVNGGQDWQVVSLSLCLVCQQVVQGP